MKTIYNLILVLLGIFIVGTTSVAAFSTEENSCNNPNCHAYPPTTINITADVTSTLTVSPGQAFTINVSWSGGNPSGTTVKWPNNTGNNLQFSISPRTLSSGPNPSGTQISNLVAPAAGNYLIRVFASRGSIPAIPKETDFKNITVQVVQQVQTFNISGFKINGTNNNGAGLQGWNISLVCPVCGSVIANTTTDQQGFYKFSNLQNGTYIVSEELKPGWMNNTPTSQQVIISGSDMTNVNFTNSLIPPQPTFSISGFKLRSTDNSGVPGWTINLTNATMTTATSTSANGMYQFTGLLNGTYTVTETMQAGWTNVTPTSIVVVIAGADAVNQNFTNTPPVIPPQTFNISGFKINGTNNNGAGLQGWNISLTCTICGSVIATTTTDPQGFYRFSNLQNNTYIVSEELKPGWTNNTPTSQQVIISGSDMTNVNFTNSLIPPQPTFSISGFKLRSTDNSGVPGWAITLTNATMTTPTTTNANGMYQFTGLLNGTYTVTETMQAGWTNVTPTSIVVVIAGADAVNRNFTNTPPPQPQTFSISGFKINDINGNNIQDPGEAGLSGWTIELRGIGAENHDIKKNTITDADGFYIFDNLPAGKYIVKEEHMKGFIPVSSPVIVVSLENGMNSENNDFMNRPISSLINRGEDEQTE